MSSCSLTENPRGSTRHANCELGELLELQELAPGSWIAPLALSGLWGDEPCARVGLFRRAHVCRRHPWLAVRQCIRRAGCGPWGRLRYVPRGRGRELHGVVGI